MQPDGLLRKYAFGGNSQLVFHFIRGDGTAADWDRVLKSCQ